ncbi:hypothetical protein CWI38_0500p0060 [Hamiltosporidium tvaerminnensis]|uniref:Uncharacterized protein n=1 Tax=Hamiltosporidium tvaerminnensis TaxID=1176355 RepID=A0A4Q9LZI4_9MICR|nr:hypothetical protein CWI38_0500p0060 [Hamiltosporidium tvaerminnensis]
MNYYSDELGLIYTFSVEIIFYIMNMDGIGTKYHYIDSIDNTYEDRKNVIKRAGMQGKPTYLLKKAILYEDSIKHVKTKSNQLFISKEKLL